MKPLSPAQARDLLEAARGERLEALYALAVTKGMRQGEILGLHEEDLDLEAETLQVRRTQWTGPDSKTGASSFIPQYLYILPAE